MKTLEFIDAYFRDELDNNQKKEFETKCEQDKNFAEDVAFYIASRQSIKELLFEQKRDLWKEKELVGRVKTIAPAKKTMLRRLMPFAIAASLLIAVAIIFFNTRTSSTQLADHYVNEHVLQISGTMDASRDSLQQGIALYNNKDYDKALEYFSTLSATYPPNSDAKKYAGYVYLVKKNYDRALDQFQELAVMKLQANPGLFLEAVTLMLRNKEGDKEKAKQLLQQVVQGQLDGSEEAAKWLKEL